MNDGMIDSFIRQCLLHVVFIINKTLNFILSSLLKKTHTLLLSTVSSDEETDDDGIPEPIITNMDYVTLTTHSDALGADPIPISWGHPDAAVRGPIICTVRHSEQKNALGAHQGQYCIYSG